MQLTELQWAVVKTIYESKEPLKPQQIGLSLGYEMEVASAAVGSSLKVLHQRGIITRHAENKRVVTYAPALPQLPQFKQPANRTGRPWRMTG